MKQNPQPTTHNLQRERRARWFFRSRWLLVVGSWLPAVAFANKHSISVFKNPDKTLNFTKLTNKLGDIANAVIPFLIAVAIVAIIWGIFRYVASAGDAEKVAEGRKVILYGIGAVFLMLSFWGLVLVIAGSLGIAP